MLSFNGGLKVYVALEPCDMRKSFHGLSAMVRNHLGLDPLCGVAFLFTNKNRNPIKILYFDSTGYWVVAKRLEKRQILMAPGHRGRPPQHRSHSSRISDKNARVALLSAYLCASLIDLNEAINEWVKVTGGELLIDPLEFRIRPYQ